MCKISKVISLDKINNTEDFLYVHNGFNDRECGACFKRFTPTEADISTKRPSTFYKTCKRCRDRFNGYRKAKETKDKII